MKKLISILVSILLVAVMAMPAAAAGSQAALTSASGASGDLVTLTLSVQNAGDVRSMAVEFTADGLEFVKASSAWLVSGGKIVDIDEVEKTGVWATDNGDGVPVDGAIMKLAFRVPAYDGTKAAFPVRCTVYINGQSNKVEASATVSINNPATGLTLDALNRSLDIGGTLTLNAAVTPANTTDKVVWTSSDPSVATVEAGRVTAVGQGQTNITATAGKLSKTCIVTVTCLHKNLTQTKAAAPSCSAAGNNLYYTCQACSTVLKADKTTVTTVEAETLAMTAHTYTGWETSETQHWQSCDVCSKATDKVNHSLSWVVDKEATATENGSKHQECACGYQTGSTVIPHTHAVTAHSAVAATCSREGSVAYWTCSSSLCAGKYYSNAACTDELQSIVTSIDPGNHKNTKVIDAREATCYSKGYTGDTYCSDCQKTVATGRDIPATGNHTAGTAWRNDETNHWHVCTVTGCGAQLDKAAHSYRWVVDKAATELETGLKHEECVCGVKRSENTVIPVLDHTHTGIKHYEAVKATCVKAGTVEYWICTSKKCEGKYYGDSACQTVLSTIVEPINASNHGDKTEVRGALEATCNTEGYTGDTYCLSCNALVKKGEAVAATGKHTPKEDYVISETEHWKLCAVCDSQIGDKQIHDMEWVVDKAATETAEGVKHQECKACGYVCQENTAIDKLVHKPVLIKGTEATCTEEGVLEHYRCNNCGRFYASDNGTIGAQIKQADTVLAATGHTYAEAWTWDETGHWQLCHCGEASEAEGHQGTVNEAGETVCSVCGYLMEAAPTEPPATQAPATEVPETAAPEETQAPAEEEQKPDGESGWLVLLAAGLAAGGAAWSFLFLKKRRKN